MTFVCFYLPFLSPFKSRRFSTSVPRKREGENAAITICTPQIDAPYQSRKILAKGPNRLINAHRHRTT